MAAPYTDIKHLESKLADLMTDNELSPRDIERACDYLGAILGGVLDLLQYSFDDVVLLFAIP